MAKYTSQPIHINSSAENVADRFSDFSRLQSYIDELPEAERAKVGDVKLSADSIILKTPQVGEITLQVVERTPNKLILSAVGSPVPMKLGIDLHPSGSESCDLVAYMEVEIPAMLKPMLGGTLQKAVDQFAELMKRIA